MPLTPARALLLSLLFIAAQTLTAAEPPPPPPPDPTLLPVAIAPADSAPVAFNLEKTVQALASANAASRAEAETALTAWVDRLGPDAAAPLQDFLNEEDPEIEKFLHALRLRIDTYTADAKLFTWYDTLGLPSIQDKPFGHIANPPGSDADYWSYRSPNDPNETYGFLLADSPTEVRLAYGWRVLTVSKIDPPPPPTAIKTPAPAPASGTALAPAPGPAPAPAPAKPRNFEPLDFDALLAQSLKQSTDSLLWAGNSPLHAIRDPNFCGSTMPFFLARVAALHHRFAISHQLLTQIQNYSAKLDPREPPPDLQKFISDSIANTLLKQAMLDCNHAKPTRPQLLREFRLVTDHFPDSDQAKEAREMATQLQIMIEEDDAHAHPPTKHWDDLNYKIAELIYQLRDINGHQWSNPGCAPLFNIFQAATKPDPWATDKLVSLGYDAVPALIELLDDRRLTRSVNVDGMSGTPYYVLRYGDCAEQILKQITGRHFDADAYSFTDGLSTEKASKAKIAARAWWAEVQKKGIDAMLIESVTQADRDAPDCARQLLQRQPEKALDILMDAARNAKEEWVRSDLIQLLATVPGEKTNAFLQHRLTDPSGSCRELAMRALWKRGIKKEPLQAAREELLGTAVALRGTPPSPYCNYPGSVAAFLLNSRDPESIACVASRYDHLGQDARMEILSAVAQLLRPAPPAAPATHAAPNETVAPVAIPDPAAFDALLINALDDDQIRNMTNWQRPTISGDYRFGDVAAYLLSERWHIEPTFDFTNPRLSNQIACVKLKNRWRLQHGETALPLPEPYPPPTADPARVTALATALLAATSTRSADLALNAYDSLGLSGLAPLEVALAVAANQNHPYPEKEQAAAALARLGSVVQTVTLVYAPDTQPLPAELAASLQALQGKPLTAEILLTWLRQYLQEKSGACQLTLERDSAGRGIRLRLRVTPLLRQVDSTRLPYFYVASELAGGHTFNPTGIEALPAARKEPFWTDEQKWIDHLLTAPPEKAGDEQLTLSWEE